MSLPACTLSIQTAQTGPYPYEPVLMPIHKNNTAISTAVKVTGEWQAILQFVANALYTTYIYSTSTYPHSTVAPLLLESSAQGVPMFQSQLYWTLPCHRWLFPMWSMV